MMNWDGIRVPVIAIEDLLVNKRASGRDKDLADIRGLQRKPPKRKRKETE
jgi:predicted nucleotidyltransferase